MLKTSNMHWQTTYKLKNTLAREQFLFDKDVQDALELLLTKVNDYVEIAAVLRDLRDDD